MADRQVRALAIVNGVLLTRFAGESKRKAKTPNGGAAQTNAGGTSAIWGASKLK